MSDLSSRHTTRILFVRHGQSVANAGGSPPDHIVNPLTELGHSQARAFAEAFCETPTLFLVSPFVRARQTSEPLVQRHPSVPVEEWSIQEFTYLEPSVHKGTNEEQQLPHIERYWERCDPAHREGPGAESFSDFLERARDTVKRLSAREPGGCIVVFTHGFFIQALRVLFLFPHATDQQLMSNFQRFHFVNFIHNTDALEFEATNGELRMVGQQHLTGFTLQGETSHA